MGLMLLLLLLTAAAAAPARPVAPQSFQGRVAPLADRQLQNTRERFFAWLKEVGCTSVPLEWRQEGVAGSGLFALSDLEAETLLGTIPLNATISTVTLEANGWLQTLRDNGIDPQYDVTALALYLLYQRHVANFGGFAGLYVATLPQSAEWAPTMWTAAEMATARAHLPHLYSKLYEHRTLLAQEYHGVRPFLANRTVWGREEPLTLEEYSWGRVMVTSRWFVATSQQAEGQGAAEELEFRVSDGMAYAHIKQKVGYSRNHLVPFLDIFNHHLVRPKGATFFSELSSWDVSPEQVFELKLLAEGERRAGQEVFISYNGWPVEDTLVHYGFLPDMPREFYEPSIDVSIPEKDPLREAKQAAIELCWPTESATHVKVMPDYLPVEVFQRAQLIMERRPELVRNLTLVKTTFCKTSSTFARHDIETLRRNKRAMLFILTRLRRALAQSVPRTRNEELLADPQLSYNMRNMVVYRQRVRDNLDRALRRLLQGNWRLLKQIHLAPELQVTA